MVIERFSMGITAGYWCHRGWQNSGYRKVDADAFDPGYAGEHYDDDY